MTKVAAQCKTAAIYAFQVRFIWFFFILSGWNNGITAIQTFAFWDCKH